MKAKCAGCGSPIHAPHHVLIQFDSVKVQFCARCLRYRPLIMLIADSEKRIREGMISVAARNRDNISDSHDDNPSPD